jgi:CBS domain-containing protein
MKHIAEVIEGRPLFHIQSSDRVRDVARLMTELNIGATAVVDSGKLVGIFSERDIMSRVVAAGLDPDETPIAKVMTKDIVVGNPAEDIEDALRKMHAVGCRHLPIVDKGNLVGFISLRDLLEVDDEDNKQRVTFLNELVTYSPDYES